MGESYLVGLEIEPVEIGHEYQSLPLHCTLMLWFTSSLPVGTLESGIIPLLQDVPRLDLRVIGEAVYGPPDMLVAKVALTPPLRILHMKLLSALTALGVTYDKPQFVGRGYSPHVSQPNYAKLSIGEVLTCRHVFLASTEDSGHKGPRNIIGRYALSDT